MEEQTQDQPASEQNERSSLTLTRLAGILLVVGAVVIALYLLVGYLAWQSGQELRMSQEQALRTQQLVRQVGLAQDDIQDGSFNLALHRLDWVLEREPDNEEAIALQRQAQAALKTALTPVAPQPATATPLPEPTIDNSKEVDPVTELVRLQRMDSSEQWAELLPAVLTLQRQFPNHERLETDRLLYDAYLNLGLQYVKGEQIELGLSYLAQAEQLGDLPQEALDYWLWSELYLEGIAYYGVNWSVSASVFRDLCVSAPFFQNSCEKLYESLINYADLYLFNEDFCPAVDLLREARQYGGDGSLSEKLREAAEGCALATATPAAITGTLPLPATTPLPLPGQ
ncbi:MAG: hypothetical protein ACK2UK_12290 [Candidatus Promineifilaceae bacterium]|jgi:uncharacterized protein YhaN